jgi:hypothetical protein
VVTKLKHLRPKLSRKISAVVRVPARTKHFALVGTAFDYLLRFELRRRAPHAVTYPWVAEYAPRMFFQEFALPEVKVVRGIIPPSGVEAVRMLAAGDSRDQVEVAKTLSERARDIVERAKVAANAFALNPFPTVVDFEYSARQALQLAALDEVFRSGRMHVGVFDKPDSDDVDDLLSLLDIVPFEKLVHPKTMHLNPHFAEASDFVGGADADLIVGDLLVDVKTTKRDAMESYQLDALLGYLLLARKQNTLDRNWPCVVRLGFYFSRHGHLWAWPATMWTDHPEFPEVERWFFEYARSLYKNSAAGRPA